MVTPRSFADFTVSTPFPLIMIGGNACFCLLKVIHSSLHLSLFSCTLFSEDHSIIWSAILCEILAFPLMTTSEVVVSSTYFHISAFTPLLASRSLISTRNNHGPNFVPCGTPDGTDSHSEKQPFASLIRWERPDKKSKIQFIICLGMSKTVSFLTKMSRSIRSKAFL